jgi:hypothetical protein
LLAAAAFGIPRAASRRRPAAWILPLAVLYVTALHGVLFAGDPRFHAPLLPAFAVLAAAALLRAEIAPARYPASQSHAPERASESRRTAA